MNKWKALALLMIALLIISVGIRFAYMGAHAFQLNDEQKSYAMNAAKDGLKDEMEGNNYNITVQDYGRIIPTAKGDKKVVRVVLTNKNMTLAVLIDMDTGAVVEKSRVEYSGWMTEYQHQNTRRLGHKPLFRAT